MSFFGVTKERISKVLPHPNADRLSIATLEGMSYQFVTQKNLYREGEEVLYFPLDSMIPIELQEKLGLIRQNEAPKVRKIKTIRLRGEISQGVVGPMSLIDGLQDTSTESITKALGVFKYEPPEIPCKHARLITLPAGLSVYDLESADRYSYVLDELLDVPVVVMEKLEGSNFGATLLPNDSKVHVHQRRHEILPIEGEEEHTWIRTCKMNRIDRFLQHLREFHYGETSQITVYGELIGPGIQGNMYGETKHSVRIFDINVNGQFVGYQELVDTVAGFYPTDFNVSYKDAIVPVLEHGSRTLREILGNKSVREYSHGVTALNDSGVLREGVVIRPLIEYTIPKFGRAILKQRDPVYLLQSET